MIGYYLKSGYRHLKQHKAFSIINIAGLSIALATSLVLISYTLHETGFDHKVPEGDKTFRVISHIANGVYWSSTFSCFGDALVNNPAVKSVTTFQLPRNGVIYYNQNTYVAKEAAIVDTNFINFFSVKLLAGQAKDIGKPNTVFLTPELAVKLFGKVDPLGKVLFLRKFENMNMDSIGYFMVKGIVLPMSDQSHFGFEMLLSQKGNFEDLIYHLKSSKTFNSKVYVKLFQANAATDLEKNLNQQIEPYLNDAFGPPLNAFASKLQALYDIHFTPGLNSEQRTGVQKPVVIILFSIGLLIIIIAMVNYINLFIAHAQYRLKESGIIKTMGGNWSVIFRNLLSEIFLSTLVSTGLACIILVIAKQAIQQFFNERVFNPFSWQFAALSITLTILVALISTITASIFYAGKPVTILLRKQQNTNKYLIQKSGILVMFQFASVILLIISSVVITKQLNYINSKNLGYHPEDVLVVKIPSNKINGSILCDELKKLPGILSVSTAHHHPAYPYQTVTFLTDYPFNFRMVDPNAIETLGIKMIKSFKGPLNELREGWIINKTFYNHLREKFSDEDIATSNLPYSSDNPKDNGTKFIIDGVMEDFNYASLHTPIENFAFCIRRPEIEFNRFLMVHFATGQSKAVITKMKDVISQFYPGLPIDYFYLNDSLMDEYKPEKQLGTLISSFSLIAVCIACLGLFGLAVIVAHRRTKEIGIRKVNGAKVAEVMTMLNKDFVKWVVIAFAIVCPVAWFAMHKWLQNFAYKTSLSWWVFAAAGGIALVIALITVSWQSFRAATRNPVEALRYE